MNAMAAKALDENSEEYKKAKADVETMQPGEMLDAYAKMLGSGYRVIEGEDGAYTLQKEGEGGTWNTVGDANSLTKEVIQTSLIERKAMEMWNANKGDSAFQEA
jgi:hypothetical protein